MRGTAPDGRAYSAQEPRLLEWVHIALVDSMLTADLLPSLALGLLGTLARVHAHRFPHRDLKPAGLRGQQRQRERRPELGV